MQYALVRSRSHLVTDARDVSIQAQGATISDIRQPNNSTIDRNAQRDAWPPVDPQPVAPRAVSPKSCEED